MSLGIRVATEPLLLVLMECSKYYVLVYYSMLDSDHEYKTGTFHLKTDHLCTLPNNQL